MHVGVYCTCYRWPAPCSKGYTCTCTCSSEGSSILEYSVPWGYIWAYLLVYILAGCCYLSPLMCHPSTLTWSIVLAVHLISCNEYNVCRYEYAQAPPPSCCMWSNPYAVKLYLWPDGSGNEVLMSVYLFCILLLKNSYGSYMYMYTNSGLLPQSLL